MSEKDINELFANGTKVDFKAVAGVDILRVPVDYVGDEKTLAAMLVKETDAHMRQVLTNQLAYIRLILKEGTSKYEFGTHLIFRDAAEYRTFPKNTLYSSILPHTKPGDIVGQHIQFTPSLF